MGSGVQRIPSLYVLALPAPSGLAEHNSIASFPIWAMLAESGKEESWHANYDNIYACLAVPY